MLVIKKLLEGQTSWFQCSPLLLIFHDPIWLQPNQWHIIFFLIFPPVQNMNLRRRGGSRQQQQQHVASFQNCNAFERVCHNDIHRKSDQPPTASHTAAPPYMQLEVTSLYVKKSSHSPRFTVARFLHFWCNVWASVTQTAHHKYKRSMFDIRDVLHWSSENSNMDMWILLMEGRCKTNGILSVNLLERRCFYPAWINDGCTHKTQFHVDLDTALIFYRAALVCQSFEHHKGFCSHCVVASFLDFSVNNNTYGFLFFFQCRMNSALMHLSLQGAWMTTLVDQLATLQDAKKLQRAGFDIRFTASQLEPTQIEELDLFLKEEDHKAARFFELNVKIASWLLEYPAYSSDQKLLWFCFRQASYICSNSWLAARWRHPSCDVSQTMYDPLQHAATGALPESPTATRLFVHLFCNWTSWCKPAAQELRDFIRCMASCSI